MGVFLWAKYAHFNRLDLAGREDTIESHTPQKRDREREIKSARERYTKVCPIRIRMYVYTYVSRHNCEYSAVRGGDESRTFQWA